MAVLSRDAVAIAAASKRVKARRASLAIGLEEPQVVAYKARLLAVSNPVAVDDERRALVATPKCPPESAVWKERRIQISRVDSDVLCDRVECVLLVFALAHFQNPFGEEFLRGG